MATTELVPIRADQGNVRAEDFLPVFTVKQAVERKQMMNEFIASVMVEGEDYGRIPGATKKVLLKPGAEKLCSIFGLSPRHVTNERVEDWTGAQHGGEPFFHYDFTCQLLRGERLMGEAAGSCNSWESKYRYRSQDRQCPVCGAEAIIRGKEQYGGGWICFKKKSGCGAKFLDDDPKIVSQVAGKVANPDVADQVNTVLKIAQKRALIAAVLVVTNCSDAFTQDLEDIEQHHAAEPVAQPQKQTEEIVPEPLRVIFDGLSKPGAVKEALQLMQNRLDAIMPTTGMDEYRRILTENGITPGTKPAIATVKLALLSMWDLAEWARAQAEVKVDA